MARRSYPYAHCPVLAEERFKFGKTEGTDASLFVPPPHRFGYNPGDECRALTEKDLLKVRSKAFSDYLPPKL